MIGRFALALAAVWLPTTTAVGGPPPAAAERHFLAGRWQQVGGVQPALESELLNPLLIVARGRMLYVVDYGDTRVKAFDWTGRLAWASGRRGAGPNEFTNPTDLQLDPRGNLWVYDPPNGRVTILRPDGKVEDMISLRTLFQRVVPLADGSFWGIGSGTEGVLGYRFERGGKLAGTVNLPTALGKVSPMALDGRVAVAPGGQAAVMTFLYADRLVLWNGATRRLTTAAGVEPIAFPGVLEWKGSGGAVVSRLSLDATPATLATTADDRYAYVLYGGKTRQAGRIVDRYDLATGRYAGSYLLPRRVSGIAAVQGGFAALISEPVPEIRIWTRVS